MSEAHRDEIAKLEALYSERPEGRVFTHLAEAYRKAGEPERALEVLQEGMVRHQDYSSAHVVHGRVLQDMGRSDEAETAFSRVLELDAQNLVALRGLGTIAAEQGDDERALDYYRRVGDIDPSDEEILATVESLERGGATRAATDGHGVEDAASGPGMVGVGPSHGDAPAPAERDDFPHHEQPESELLLTDEVAAEAEAAPDEPGLVDLASLDEALGQEPAASSTSWPEAADTEETETEPSGLDDGGGPAMVGPGIDALGEAVDEAPADEMTADEMTADEGTAEEVTAEEGTADETTGAEAAGSVVTETMGDVYARQGLYSQAAEVYEQLLRQRPGDERLRSKLDEARSALAGPEPESTWEAAHGTAGGMESDDAARDGPGSAPDERVGGDDGLAAWVAPTEEEATASAEPPGLEDAPAIEETGDTGAASVEGLESGEFEPPAEPELEAVPLVEGFETETEASTGGALPAESLEAEEPEEPISPDTELDALDIGPTPDYEAFEWELAGERPDVEDAGAGPEPEGLAAEPIGEAGPASASGPAADEPVGSAEAGEPASATDEARIAEEPVAEEPVAEEPVREEPTEEPVTERAEAASLEREEPEAETVESVWTGASGATVGEETPYAWAAEAQEERPDADEDADKAPIGDYLHGLIDWRAKREGAAPAPVEEPAAESVPAESVPVEPEPTEPEPTEPEAVVVEEEGAAAAPEAGEEDEEEGGEDDLDMFRSWLESLKH